MRKVFSVKWEGVRTFPTIHFNLCELGKHNWEKYKVKSAINPEKFHNIHDCKGSCLLFVSD